MSRLVVVSNRLPALGKKTAPKGGLAVALEAALGARGGVWMGWSGKASGTRDPDPLAVTTHGRITVAATDLSTRDLSEYYAGFANSVLWPLCHYRIDLTDYARRDMEGYFRVNRFFASRLVPFIAPEDLIWVHDYHLIPLASELRRAGVKNRMGFFIHIPWPSPDVFFTLPVHEEILRGLTEYDVVGFQTADDAENFILALKRLGVGGPDGPGWARAWGRRFRVDAWPIGITTEAFAETARRHARAPAVRSLKESLQGRSLIVGVDRLDYSKGLLQRIEGYERFLLDHPSYQGATSLLQISPKSRSEVQSYGEMQRRVAEAAGRVNGALGAIDWTPVRYVNQAFSQPTLAGIYRLARAALVTPLRDGMNLVAKEYVAAQDPADPGVLVLSRFAGAAHELTAALIVNPYDLQSISTALARALEMPLEARQERHAEMMRQLREHDITRWCNDFLAALEAGGPERLPAPLAPGDGIGQEGRVAP